MKRNLKESERCSKEYSEKIDMTDYENTLHKHKAKNVNFNAIRSKNHQMYSINQSNVGLTSYDNKRYWMNDTESVPYGHYSIMG